MALCAFSCARVQALAWINPGQNPKWEAALPDILTPNTTAHLPPALALNGAPSDWVTARCQESELMAITDLSGQLIGTLILAETALGVRHIGYVLGRPHWGKGLASEVLLGLCKAARAAGITRLVGGVDLNNPASIRVLEKAGFRENPNLGTAQTLMLERVL